MEVIVLFAAIIGMLIGSFLNVCIYRLPKGQSVITPRSHCTHCKTALGVCDLIPLFSCIVLKSRCRHCNNIFSPRYAFVELFTGVLFSVCFILVEPSIVLIKLLVSSCFLIVIAFIDYDYQLILNKMLIWFASTGLIINLYIGIVTILDMVIASVVGGGILLLIAIITKGGIGGGDIKFVTALGLWLGLKLTLLTIFLSFIIGGIGSVLLLAFKIKKRKDFIPFGPFIAIAAFISMLYGTEIISWYLETIVK
ncbi:MAG: Prepilin peptidase [Sporomusa sp.]|nr:Prepilin peptidase [Sporomusa sp.]